MNTNPQLKTPLARSSLIVMFVSLVVILLSLFFSGLFFSGFLGGGRSVIGVLQAFLLCFGIGALVYMPALAIFLMARHVRGNGPERWIGGLTAILALPAWVYGGLALHYKFPYPLWAALGVAVSLYLCFWAVIVFRHGRQ